MDWIATIKAKRPWDVYVGGLVVYVILFLNSAEFFGYRFDLVDVFEPRNSIVYGLIRGVGDDHINSGEAEVFFWFLSVLYVGLVLNKARAISRWIWNEPPR